MINKVRRRTSVKLALVAIGLFILGSCSQSNAASPDPPIHVLTRPDDATRLTTPPAGDSDQNPAFSPDGSRLVFTRFENGYNTGPASLFLLDLTSGQITRLTPVEDQDNVNLPGAAWDAVSNRIVFASDRQEADDLWRIAPDGADFSRITTHTSPPWYFEPSWSPDGQWIVFEASQPGDSEDGRMGQIWKVRADGTDLTQLTDGSYDDRQPNWSPAGDRILFQRRTPGPSTARLSSPKSGSGQGSDDWNLYTITPTGSSIRPVTTAPSSDTDASWSPDGRWIVYSSDYGGLPVPNIFIVPAEACPEPGRRSCTPIRVTRDDAYEDSAPSWSPDGRWIAFESHLAGQDEDTPASLWRIAVPSLAHSGSAGKVLNAQPPTQPGALYATTSPTLPRTFTLTTPLFAPDSAWNQVITWSAVWPASDQQILVTYRVLRGDTTSLHPTGQAPPTTWPFPYVNYDDYTIPVFPTGTGQQSVLLCDYYSDPGGTNADKLPVAPDGTVTVPVPAGTVRPAGPEGQDSDGHVVLYNPDTFTEYDFWQATTVRNAECDSLGGGLTGTTILEAGAIDFFDVRGPGANPDTYFSARATGVPLLAGLILPEDVEGGAIEHALAVAIPGLRNTSDNPYEPLPSDYFHPASTTETDFYNSAPNALAAGQRIRLKAGIVDETCNSIDENSLAPITRMFLAALRTYGAILVDNAGGFTFYAEDIHTADLDLSDAEVQALIGQSSLPVGKTKWQIVIETLNLELEQIPFACGPWTDGQDPVTATITTANFEVVAPHSVYLPLVLRSFSPPSNLTEPMPLANVNYWAYQLQGISEPGAVDALVASHYDMLVLEPTRTDWSSDGDMDFDTRGMVRQLKNSPASDGVHRKLVIAYVDIGEAEDWRWYWTWSPKEWDCAGDPPATWPDYILACDPDGWAGNYPVAYWDPRWKDIVIYGNNQGSDPDRDYNSVIDEVIKDGFDGIYLDWVEGYEDKDVVAAAQAAGKDPALEMIAFIQEMRAYAAARNPDFIIVQQNAAALIEGHSALTGVIDGIAQEAVWYDGTATDDDWNDPNGYDRPNDPDLTDYYIGYLDQYLARGLPVFNCEYALDHAATAYTNSLNRGYVPYVTRRSLSQLTTTPPPGY